MRKPKYPAPPRSMCDSFLHWILGIHSPSQMLRLRMYGPRSNAERKYVARIAEYNKKVRCCKGRRKA